MKKVIFFISLSLFFMGTYAQELNPVTWDFSSEIKGEHYLLHFKANIEENWYLYAQELPPDGPIPTKFYFDEGNKVVITGLATENSDYLKEVYDEMFLMDLKKYAKQVIFTYKIAYQEDLETIKGYVEFMSCDAQQCLAPKMIDFTIKLK